MSVLLQLSAGQGPKECGEAVARAVKKIMKDAAAAKIALEIVEHNQTSEGTRSVVFALEDSAEAWARKWEGSMLWICPLRSGSARKNWYFSGSVFAPSRCRPSIQRRWCFKPAALQAPEVSTSTPPIRPYRRFTPPAA